MITRRDAVVRGFEAAYAGGGHSRGRCGPA